MIPLHVAGAIAPPSVSANDPQRGCCMGDAVWGPHRCTCWEPIYDLEQQPLENGGNPPDELPTRDKCCHDCAYRNGSPEREAGETDVLLERATSEGQEFWCHQGVRRAIAYRHPDGTILPAGDGDYHPPKGPPGREVIWKADGSVGERCAGWAAHARGAGREVRA